jgi:hypothetical protein
MCGRIVPLAVAALGLSLTPASAQTFALWQGPETSRPAYPRPGNLSRYERVYRLVGNNGPDHLYTTDPNEVRRVTDTGSYRLERGGFYALDRQYPGTVPLYRFCTANVRHLLGTSVRDGAAAGGRLEGMIGYVYTEPAPGTTPLYAWYNPASGDYFYTTDPSGELAPLGNMRYQGVVCYVLPAA